VTTRSGSHGATTHPESVTGGRAGSARGVAVRWVFPTERTTPLPDVGTFGRDPECTLVLPGKDVSRRHAEARRAGLLPVVRDLESRNGTWVNGVKIEEQPLGPNDVLRIGEWVGLVVELRSGEVSPGLMEMGEGWFGGAALASAIDPARRVAGSDLPVIVQGETGTGKEGIARAVHAWSRRRGPFIGVNCAAIQVAMAEGELFGYRKGAFTGADRANEGFFRAADGGTLFLDEILELPASVQSKLLRALEQREVQPLGEPRPLPVDVRIVCATQEPLSRAVADRRFRADLLGRLDGVTITLPPLRERREDIAPLFLRLLHDLGGGGMPPVDPKLIESLLLYDWPLNVRELVLLVRRMLAMHRTEPSLKRSMLPERMTGTSSTRAPSAPPGGSPTTDDAAAFDRFLLALRASGGNVSRAAAALGISRARAYRLLEARPEVNVRSLRKNER
jgi:transcriptional regulator with AAA-type ATPase domain